MPPGGIRTLSPSRQAAAYPRLRPLDHWDRSSGNIDPRIVHFETRWGDFSASLAGRVTVRERTFGTHRTGGWVGLTACLYAVEERCFAPVSTLSVI